VHAQNLRALSTMSAQEVGEALEELQSRLPAKMLAFLKARGAKKAAAAAATGTRVSAPVATTTAKEEVSQQ
jgi:hypothetical protein